MAVLSSHGSFVYETHAAFAPPHWPLVDSPRVAADMSIYFGYLARAIAAHALSKSVALVRGDGAAGVPLEVGDWLLFLFSLWMTFQ